MKGDFKMTEEELSKIVEAKLADALATVPLDNLGPFQAAAE